MSDKFFIALVDRDTHTRLPLAFDVLSVIKENLRRSLFGRIGMSGYLSQIWAGLKLHLKNNGNFLCSTSFLRIPMIRTSSSSKRKEKKITPPLNDR